MRKIIFLLAAIIGLMTSCTGVKTSSSGVDNQAFINIVGKPGNYSGGVDVNVDDKTNFKAEVNKEYTDRPKGKVYAIGIGTHVVIVSYNGQVLYKQQIFVSSQETKKIVLP
jgi:hypothetical protein